MIQLFEENDAYRKMITMISEAEDEEYEIQRFGKQLQSGVNEERAKLMELECDGRLKQGKEEEAQSKDNGGKKSKGKAARRARAKHRTGARQERQASAFRRRRTN